MGTAPSATLLIFLSTLSLRRATACLRHLTGSTSISIHALLAESDFRTYGDVVQGIEFLSTLSLRRATIGPAPALQPQTFLSTLSLRRATQDNLGLTGTTAISIHALLAESDSPSATSRAAPGDFYPRSPCGERPQGSADAASKSAISIHALLAESDDIKPTSVLTLVQFLSTLSLRRATISGGSNFPANKKFLSTLSLRRATISAIAYPPKNSNFYPRSPCGERHLEVDRLQIIFDISIHALLAESDRVSLFAPGARDQFLSTLSLRRATYSSNGEPSPFAFLSTLSLRRATL